VPKALQTQAISAGAGRSLAEITPEELAPLAGIRGVTPEENSRQLLEAVRNDGQWVTNNEETGLNLTLNGYRVLGKDGKPVSRTWGQLQQTGTQQREIDATVPTFRSY
jgi:hypothetical protein